MNPPGQKLIVRSGRAHYSLNAMLGGFHSHACVCCLLFSKAACPVLCSGNGQYLKGRCMCHSGWKGSECDVPTNQCIDVTCSSHGTCIVGTCICNPGYKGENCEEGDVAQNGGKILHVLTLLSAFERKGERGAHQSGAAYLTVHLHDE